MWVLNIFLFLNFIFNPDGYKELVAAGEPCWGYVAALGSDQSPQPACPYDPSNTNLFVDAR